MSFWDKKKHFRDVVGLDFSPTNALAYLSYDMEHNSICGTEVPSPWVLHAIYSYHNIHIVGLKSHPLGFFCNAIWGLDFSPTNAKAYLSPEMGVHPICGTEVPTPFVTHTHSQTAPYPTPLSVGYS